MNYKIGIVIQKPKAEWRIENPENHALSPPREMDGWQWRIGNAEIDFLQTKGVLNRARPLSCYTVHSKVVYYLSFLSRMWTNFAEILWTIDATTSQKSINISTKLHTNNAPFECKIQQPKLKGGGLVLKHPPSSSYNGVGCQIKVIFKMFFFRSRLSRFRQLH